jgi:hypothetical protein
MQIEKNSPLKTSSYNNSPSSSQETAYRITRWRILFVLGIFSFTLIPISSLIEWYNQLLTSQGLQTQSGILYSPMQVWEHIMANRQALMKFMLLPLGKNLFKWGLIGLGIWLLLSKFTLAEIFYVKARPLFDKIERNKIAFLTIIFLFLLILTSILSYTTRQFLPDNMDSVAQLFQAKLFMMGKLYTKPHPLMEFFYQPFFILKQGKWYSQYGPAHAFFLMLGLWIGAPWLVNPLLSACSGLFLYKIAQRIYNTQTACIAIILFSFSPLVYSFGSGFMNCVTSLFFMLLFLLFFIKSEQESSLSNPLWSGFFLGCIANIRPLTGITIALPFALRWLYLAWYDTKRHLKNILVGALGLSIALGILFAYNYLTNGSPFLFGAQVYNQTASYEITMLGFGKSQFGAVHTPFRAIIHMLDKINLLNEELFGWFIPSLLFIFLFWLFPSKKKTWDFLQLFPILCLISAYFFYAFVHVRYFYSLLPFFILLTARGLLTTGESLTYFSKKLTREKAKGTLYLVLIFCVFYNLVINVLPDLLSPVGKQKNLVYNIVSAEGLKQAIVFMEPGYGTWGIFMRGFVHNSPDLNTEVIYAKDLGEKNQNLMHFYPKRSYYRYSQKDGKGKLESYPVPNLTEGN